jgi:hypothetical protein
VVGLVLGPQGSLDASKCLNGMGIEVGGMYWALLLVIYDSAGVNGSWARGVFDWEA